MTDEGLPLEAVDGTFELLVESLVAWLRQTIDAPTEAGTAAKACVERLRGLADGLESGRARSQLDLVFELLQTHAALVEGLQRKTIRLGFDLHDGAIQNLAVVGLDLQLLRGEVDRLGPTAAGRVGELVELVFSRMVALEDDLRELAHSFETPALADIPLEETVRGSVAKFSTEAGVEAKVEVEGDLQGTTASQRIAIVRILQGTLANIHGHAEATRVDVLLRSTRERLELVIEDDGKGFAVEQTLVEAAKRGRLGFVAMSERVRLLGGEFNLDSRPGGPTRVFVSLKMQPPAAARGASPPARWDEGA